MNKKLPNGCLMFVLHPASLRPHPFSRTRSSAESERKLAELEVARSNRAGSFFVSGSSNRQDAWL